jgi:hypothetical protein
MSYFVADIGYIPSHTNVPKKYQFSNKNEWLPEIQVGAPSNNYISSTIGIEFLKA